MGALECYQRTASLLPASAKSKAVSAAPAFARALGSASTSDAAVMAAHNAVKPYFPTATSVQMDVLAFYVIAITMAAEGDTLAPETFRAKLNSMTESGLLDGVRLQIFMDRRSKVMDALTNLLKKISDTSSQIIQNLK